MTGGTREVQATFWLLDAPTSLLAMSASQPDGVGLGTFNGDGTPSLYRKPVALSRSQTFIAGAHDVRSRTFLAHVRHATAGEPTVENTHPFEQHGRLFAHNGVIGGLEDLRRRLGPYAELVRGSTDSELYFTLITRHIAEHGGDIGAGIASAANEMADHVPLYSLNMILTTPDELWALRYPATNELWILERSMALNPEVGLDERSASGIVRVQSAALALQPATVIASEPMDSNPKWRQFESGELVHVDAQLRISSSIVVDHEPSELLVLNTQEAVAQGDAA